MMDLDLAHLRLRHQRLTGDRFERPEDLVRWLGVVQAQDYAGAKWAVAQRTSNTTDAELDRAVSEGRILRTHVLRPTWHFVVPADIRWLLALTAPRLHAQNARWYRDLELGGLDLGQADAALATALAGGRQRTRAELATDLRDAGLGVGDGLPLTTVLMHAELNAVICSGAPHGKQQTYALLGERAPQAAPLSRAEALARLAERYFRSHGPATLKDFVWWSGLTLTDAKAAVEMVQSRLVQEAAEGQTYWRAPSSPPGEGAGSTVHLLPNFDEYIVGYANRSAIFDATHTEKLNSRQNPLFQNTILVGGRMVGTWQRTLKRDAVIVQATAFAPFTESYSRALSAAAARYGDFLDLPVVLSGIAR
jgi:hypothetical protein